VNVELLIELLLEARIEARLRTTVIAAWMDFLHHLAQLAGVLQLAFARNNSRFDRQQLAAHFRPGEPGDLTNTIQILGLAVANRRTPRNLSRLRV